MGAVVPPRVPRGMRDILPDKMILRQYVEGVIREVFESFSFQPLATPGRRAGGNVDGEIRS